ncbi:PilZ domain-containing protein [Thiopseudomonas alkaliphila]|uniref:PilZ domain-containing protein n=1 Tax=Thiopseudomonas alkaliphila TaxID=1697053 RepID=A0AAW7DM15_9GAMM|nr:PilZ domain-containing protein [Thiopseudomonas alkaliphila]MDM1695152.1 PilZ domain-containing protein [Thiopseudomonas alkaliphila]MDM1707224.1 PilZ domain-containing protein [Thiopseudomonas alkaliphila]
MALGPGLGILNLAIKDLGVLYSSYMSFIKEGGLFIPTTRKYAMGDEVFVLLSLMDEPEKLPITGKVVWITPLGAQGNKQAGIGIQLGEKDLAVRKKIEAYLAGAQKSDRPTFTI